MLRYPAITAKQTIGLLAVAATALLAQPSVVAQDAGDAATAALDAAIGGAHRSEANKARDRYRHPGETLAFFGFRPDMTVVEMLPGGGGWYTEILAPALKENGKLYAAHYGANAGNYERRSLGAFLTKIASEPEIYGGVTVTALSFPHELEVAPRESADLVLTFRNVHNWLEGESHPDIAALGFTAMFDALKPGGILGVVDHRWPDPETEDRAAASGYISEERTIAYAEAAGFELAGRSDINRNPRDSHDHPEGVWTLPPSLRLGDQDRDKYLEIGESDRFTLKFVKPKSGSGR
jgi:predicted methyltransferase